jgi:hypothetical protein
MDGWSIRSTEQVSVRRVCSTVARYNVKLIGAAAGRTVRAAAASSRCGTRENAAITKDILQIRGRF